VWRMAPGSKSRRCRRFLPCVLFLSCCFVRYCDIPLIARDKSCIRRDLGRETAVGEKLGAVRDRMMVVRGGGRVFSKPKMTENEGAEEKWDEFSKLPRGPIVKCRIGQGFVDLIS